MRVAEGHGALTPVAADAILGAFVAIGLVIAAVVDVGMVNAGAVALAVAVAAATAARRRYPITVLVVLNAVTLVWFLGACPGRLITLVPLVGLAIWIGLYPHTFLNVLHAPAQNIINQVQPYLAEHGNSLLGLVGSFFGGF